MPKDLLLERNSLTITNGSSITKSKRQQRQGNQYVGAATAGTRAILSQMVAFYTRIPVKLFRPTRVDYMVVPRAINPAYKQNLPWSFGTHSTLALLTHAVKEHGWGILFNQVFPPLIANSLVGVILYTTYLTALPVFSEHLVKASSYDSFAPTSDVLTAKQTFLAGFCAGGAQSVAAAPLDAIFTRFSVSELLSSSEEQQGRYKSMWRYGAEKLKDVGIRGVFAGFGLSFVKEALGFGLFFATFEGVRQWSYDKIVHGYQAPIPKYVDRRSDVQNAKISEKPSAAIYPLMIIVAGAAATTALQIVHYPLTKLQTLQFSILEGIDFNNSNENNSNKSSKKPSTLFGKTTFGTYYNVYREVFRQAKALKNVGYHKSWVRWLYKGWLRNTVTTLPSSSIGLFVFEIMRIRYVEETGLSYDTFEP
ncbi:mitochondrial carrier domain-containing protein [Dipodascopsis uninucleata]